MDMLRGCRVRFLVSRSLARDLLIVGFIRSRRKGWPSYQKPATRIRKQSHFRHRIGFLLQSSRVMTRFPTLGMKPAWDQRTSSRSILPLSLASLSRSTPRQVEHTYSKQSSYQNHAIPTLISCDISCKKWPTDELDSPVICTASRTAVRWMSHQRNHSSFSCCFTFTVMREYKINGGRVSAVMA